MVGWEEAKKFSFGHVYKLVKNEKCFIIADQVTHLFLAPQKHLHTVEVKLINFDLIGDKLELIFLFHFVGSSVSNVKKIHRYFFDLWSVGCTHTFISTCKCSMIYSFKNYSKICLLDF